MQSNREFPPILNLIQFLAGRRDSFMCYHSALAPFSAEMIEHCDSRDFDRQFSCILLDSAVCVVYFCKFLGTLPRKHLHKLLDCQFIAISLCDIKKSTCMDLQWVQKVYTPLQNCRFLKYNCLSLHPSIMGALTILRITQLPSKLGK